jgi:hypothetical protein
MDWNLVEKNIKEEMVFLKDNIQLSPFNHSDPIKCADCLFRILATFVISGRIKVREVNYHDDSIWGRNHLVLEFNEAKKHGAFWHDSKINIIKKYFETNKFKTQSETKLFYGRCDLSIPDLKVFIEVGTINLYKLYLNLLNMKKCQILLVLSDSSLLEFIL